MSDASDSGDVDSLGFLASRELRWLEALSRTADHRPAAFLAWSRGLWITNSKLNCLKPGLSLSSVLFFAIANCQHPAELVLKS